MRQAIAGFQRTASMAPRAADGVMTGEETRSTFNSGRVKQANGPRARSRNTGLDGCTKSNLHYFRSQSPLVVVISDISDHEARWVRSQLGVQQQTKSFIVQMRERKRNCEKAVADFVQRAGLQQLGKRRRVDANGVRLERSDALPGHESPDIVDPSLGISVRNNNRFRAFVLNYSELFRNCRKVQLRAGRLDPVFVQRVCKVELAEVIVAQCGVRGIKRSVRRQHRIHHFKSPAKHSLWRQRRGTKHIDMSFRDATLAVAAPSRLDYRVQTGQRPIQDEEVDIHSRFNQLRRDEPAGVIARENLADLSQHCRTVCRTHQRGKVKDRIFGSQLSYQRRQQACISAPMDYRQCARVRANPARQCPPSCLTYGPVITYALQSPRQRTSVRNDLSHVAQALR